MVLLIHHPTVPQARKIRALMSEKRMLFALREEEPWNMSQEALKLNPAAELPIFVNDGKVLCGDYAICEYLEETSPEISLIFGDALHKAEIRRLCGWFDGKFYKEVHRNIVYEKVHKRFATGQAPDSRILKVGLNNLNFHLEYLDWILERRTYLAGEEFSLADIAAAAQFSVVDYLGDVPWEGYRNAKLWYAKVKSRPCFKDILKDNIRGILPAKHYANLDF